MICCFDNNANSCCIIKRVIIAVLLNAIHYRVDLLRKKRLSSTNNYIHQMYRKKIYHTNSIYEKCLMCIFSIKISDIENYQKTKKLNLKMADKAVSVNKTSFDIVR